MLTYFQIIQYQLKTKEIYNPIKKIKIPYTNKTIIISNNNYWKNIQQNEFSLESNIHDNKQIKILYFIFMETIAKYINTKVLTTTPTILIQEKYKAYKTLITNIFLGPEMKKKIQTIFEKTQKCYFTLTKFSRHIKQILNKTNNNHQHKITTDLSLTPLNPNDKHTFIVYENSNSYLFSIIDLINIIKTAITNAPNFFENPLEPKNPYTNIPLTTATLQAFFYKLHKIYYPIPPILENYYKCQYNLKWFSIQNQMEIRDIAIKNFIVNSPITILHEEILEMIDDFFYNPQTDDNIKIDKEFPMHQLINIMRPYLYVFLMGEYHIHGSEKQIQAKRVFRKAKQIFINYNPRFGEQIPIQEPPIQPKKQKRTNKGSQTPSSSTEAPLSSLQTFNFTPKYEVQQPQSPPIFVFKPPTPSLNENQKNTLKFFDEHPKFSIKDIEIYLQDLSKLKQIQPIRRPRSPPIPIYTDFDTDDELSETDP